MKLYTDKMPNECFECPCFQPNDEMSCRLAEINEDYDKCCYRGDDAPDDAICPLHDIAELQKGGTK